MNVLTYLTSLRPALPTSAERPPEPMTNSEVRRLLLNKAVLLNGETDWKWDEDMPDWVWQLVFFPSSTKRKPGKPARRTTTVQYDF